MCNIHARYICICMYSRFTTVITLIIAPTINTKIKKNKNNRKKAFIKQ